MLTSARIRRIQRFSSLLLFASAMAQSPETPKVTKNVMCDVKDECGHTFINGRMYESAASDGVDVTVAFEVVEKYLRADIFVLNGGTHPVNVLPSNFVLLETSPKQRQLKWVDSDKVMRSAERRLAWGNALIAMSGNMQRQQNTTTTSSIGTVNARVSDGTTVMGTYNGTSTSTTSTPDYGAQARAAQTIQTRNEAFANLASFASRTVLRANTIPPNESVRGYVLFEGNKKAKIIMLSCVVGDTIYQFPFEWHAP